MAQPDITPASADVFAGAVVGEESFVVDAEVVASPGGGGTIAMGTGDRLGGFPLGEEHYGVLSTGSPASAIPGSPPSGEVFDPAPTAGRGGNAYDTTIVNFTVDVPAGATCFVVTYRMFSDEGSNPDTFLAQLNGANWSFPATGLSRPGDFAASGRVPMTPLAGGDLASQPGFAAGTTYSTATGFIDAKTPVGPGQANVFLSLFDANNASGDTTVFLGQGRFTTEGAGECRSPNGLLRTQPPGPSLENEPPLGALPTRPPARTGSGSIPDTRIPPRNQFRLARVTRLPDGSLRLRIRVPRRGVLSASFAGPRASASLVRRVRRVVRRPGVVSLRVAPNRTGRQRLQRAGTMRALVRIRFTPRGGVPLTQVRRFTFRRR